MTEMKLIDFSLYKELKKFILLKVHLKISFLLTALNFKSLKAFIIFNTFYFSLKSDYKELFL